MQSAWQEPQLIKYGSAIEDLLSYKCKPQYYEYVAKIFPLYES